MKIMVEKKPTKDRTEEVSKITTKDEEVEVLESLRTELVGRRKGRRKSVKVVRKKGSPDGSADGVEAEVPVDVPRYDFARKADFQLPWHLAMWVPNDPSGPTVYINLDSPILEEVVKYHQEQYPLAIAEEVGGEVRRVFGEVAACKIAHSQKLTKEIASEDLDQFYRNEQALTVALMGLMAEESLIAQRLGRYGRKRSSAA